MSKEKPDVILQSSNRVVFNVGSAYRVTLWTKESAIQDYPNMAHLLSSILMRSVEEIEIEHFSIPPDSQP